MAAKRAPRGSVVKGENINVRIDPKIKYGLELVARRQHRTLTSVVEWALGKALRDEKDGLVNPEWDLCEAGYPVSDTPRLVYFLDKVWSPDEIIRFLNLVYFDDSLLSYEESMLWSLISENSYYWTGKCEVDQFTWDPQYRGHMRLDRVREDWEILNAIAYGEKTTDALPIWNPAAFLSSKGKRTIWIEHDTPDPTQYPETQTEMSSMVMINAPEIH